MSLYEVPVGVSNRHLHLSRADLDTLFGEGYELTVRKDLSQRGQYASEETVDVVGPKGTISRVRVLGPVRKRTQVEISRTDSFKLGVQPPVRDSGDLDGSPGIKLIGPKAEITIPVGVIVAKRHIHMTPEEAERIGLKDKDIVMTKVNGARALIFDEVLVRVDDSYTWEFHIDTDEANAACLGNGDLVTIIKKVE
ncbi:MAG: phosphate propanoyltransferase [Bacillota bacterium]|jgi:putative phosphotransacetylase|nr:phosphate propanoyltransferase [Bacillota bacterium]HOB43534.1 phosphate propanoyltransferase [Bacillota bacterium]HOK71826.1 phosphate propanoyltransferase [Bacillota bacterium]HOL52430.1 phosphate propanoyltransferase [Bacillota bacterium]HOO30431.1 phosphate propanoyltransferase [Bacillota bacterium]